MDSDDECIVYLPSTCNGSRSDLYVARTLLQTSDGERYHFWGLYCHNSIPKGSLIGMYSGVWVRAQDRFAFGNRYAVQVADSWLVSPPGQRPDPQKYPIAMANEPSSNARANAMLQEFELERQDVASIPDHVDATLFCGVGLVACDYIPADVEIVWDYGPSYASLRDYVSGDGCTVTTHVHPPEELGHAIPYHCVSPVLNSPSVSDDEANDPTYDPAYQGHKVWRALSMMAQVENIGK